MTTKRSGTWALSCGHVVTKALDTNARQTCPTCKADAVVIRETKA